MTRSAAEQRRDAAVADGPAPGPPAANPTRTARTSPTPAVRAPTTLAATPPPASPPASPAAPESPGGSSSPAKTGGWLVPVLVLVVGNFMAVLDITIVNVAVPAIQKDFGGTINDVLRIATAYTLMLAVVVPLSSWLGERFGT